MAETKLRDEQINIDGTPLKDYIDRDKGCAFSAAVTGDNISIPTDTVQKIAFNLEDLDVGGDFGLGNSEFTAPVDGIYLISFGITWRILSTGTDIRSYLYLNGSSVRELISANAGTFTVMSGSYVLELSADDVIDLRARHTEGTTGLHIASGARRTFLTGCLLYRT